MIDNHYSYILQYFLDSLHEDIFVYDIKGKKHNKAEIISGAKKVAHYLNTKGYTKGDSVGLITEDGSEYIINFLGIMLAGCTVTIIDPYSNTDIINNQLILCKTKILLTSKKLQFLSHIPFVDTFTKYTKRISISRLTKYKTVCLSDIESNTNYEKIYKIKYHNNANFVYIPTSGTTDNPKIVIHTYKSFFASIKRLQSIPIDGAIFGTDLPYLGVIGLFLGKSIFLLPRSDSIEKSIHGLMKQKVDILFLPPNQLQGTYKIPEHIKTILLGSAPIYTSFLKQLGERSSQTTNIIGLYGMTECLPISRYYLVDKTQEEKEDYLGVVFDDIDYSISEEGEMVLRGESNACYLQDANSIINEIYTGDIVSVGGKKIYMLSRKKNMIIKDGINIYPSLYENNYLKISGVKEAVLFGYYNEKKHDEDIVLAIDKDEKSNEKIIKKHIRNIILHQQVDIDAIIFTIIPKTGRQNKTDYKKLKYIYTQTILGK